MSTFYNGERCQLHSRWPSASVKAYNPRNSSSSESESPWNSSWEIRHSLYEQRWPSAIKRLQPIFLLESSWTACHHQLFQRLRQAVYRRFHQSSRFSFCLLIIQLDWKASHWSATCHNYPKMTSDFTNSFKFRPSLSPEFVGICFHHVLRDCIIQSQLCFDCSTDRSPLRFIERLFSPHRITGTGDSLMSGVEE